MKEVGIFTLVIYAGIFLFGIYVLFFFVPLGIWFTALISGIRISLLDLIYMKLRRVAPYPIVRSMIMAEKADIHIPLDALEEHSFAGGNVENVVRGMIAARNKNVLLSFEEACQMDLAQKDIAKEY